MLQNVVNRTTQNVKPLNMCNVV